MSNYKINYNSDFCEGENEVVKGVGDIIEGDVCLKFYDEKSELIHLTLLKNIRSVEMLNES